MQFLIGGIKKTSLIDFPNKIAAIVFTQGCNFNCGFCHNPSLLEYRTETQNKVNDFFQFLEKRRGKIEGVVITGGEPTIQKDLIPFITEIKQMGFLVKLDTNGSKPDILRTLISENLIDYIAMDIKSSLEKYSFIANVNVDTEKIKESIDLIMKSNIDYEFRTTFMPYYHRIEDFEQIGKLIKEAKSYYLQKFEILSEINNNELRQEKNFTDSDIAQIINILKQYIKNVEVR